MNLAKHMHRFIRTALVVLCLLTTYIYALPAIGGGVVEAATILFEPDSGTLKVGESIDIEVKAVLGSEEAKAIDVYIPYDSTKFRLVNIAQPPSNKAFYPQFFKRIWENKIFIGGSVQLGNPPKGGSGLLGTITLEPLQAGQYSMAIKCEPPKPPKKYNFADSSISVKKNSELVDLLICSDLKPLELNVTGGTGGDTPTATATPTTGPVGGGVATATPTVVTATPTPATSGATLTPTVMLSASPSAVISTLPATGTISSGASFIIIGILLSVAGFLVKVMFF